MLLNVPASGHAACSCSFLVIGSSLPPRQPGPFSEVLTHCDGAERVTVGHLQDLPLPDLAENHCLVICPFFSPSFSSS